MTANYGVTVVLVIPISYVIIHLAPLVLLGVLVVAILAEFKKWFADATSVDSWSCANCITRFYRNVMFVIFDSNIWLSHLALNSASGAAIRFYVLEQGATVVIPEVVRLEVEKNLKRKLLELTDRMANDHAQLLTIFGELKELALPTQNQIEEKVVEAIAKLDVPTRDLPFSMEAARSSFMKTIEKLPPSDKNQQFKDGVIWANCVELLDEADVHLVTADKAFYADRDYSKGLAPNLLSEIKDLPHNVVLFDELAKLLKAIRKEVKIDEGQLVDAFLEEELSEINRLLASNGFSLLPKPKVDARLYATENADMLFIEFMITFNCEDVSEKNRSEAILELPGDGFYIMSTKEFSELRSQGRKLIYKDEEGRQKYENIVMAVGSAIFGHRTVKHTVRHPIG